MNPKALSQFNFREAKRGFSMIEVLVTLLVISLALLGTAGLQAYAMRLNQGGQFRTQAVFLAADLAERIEANKSAAMAGNYEISGTYSSYAPVAGASAVCVAASCSQTELADFDLAQWQSAVVASLPQSSWSVDQTFDGSAKTASQACTPSIYTITLSWVDRRAEANNAAGTTGVTYDPTSSIAVVSGGAVVAEKFSYVATRAVCN
jgi:type IV pilus assembly protein PilV